MNRPALGEPVNTGDDSQAKIIFSERDVADAKRLLAKIALEPRPDETIENGVFADASGRGHLLSRATAALANRKRRAEIFRGGMFGEPAWEMLLALYLSHNGQRESIESLRHTAGVTLTTALRWLEFLEGEMLVRRLEHRFDRRRVTIELTEKGQEMLDLYFSGTL